MIVQESLCHSTKSMPMTFTKTKGSAVGMDGVGGRPSGFGGPAAELRRGSTGQTCCPARITMESRKSVSASPPRPGPQAAAAGILRDQDSRADVSERA